MEEVTVVPDVHAGGSLATYAYKHMNDPIVVEHISVPKGIDIGQTLMECILNTFVYRLGQVSNRLVKNCNDCNLKT